MRVDSTGFPSPFLTVGRTNRLYRYHDETPVHISTDTENKIRWCVQSHMVHTSTLQMARVSTEHQKTTQPSIPPCKDSQSLLRVPAPNRKWSLEWKTRVQYFDPLSKDMLCSHFCALFYSKQWRLTGHLGSEKGGEDMQHWATGRIWTWAAGGRDSTQYGTRT